jgi:hypothetical protein
LGALQLGLGRAKHVLAIDVADARSTDRAAERNAGDGHCGGSAEHRGNIGIDFRIAGHHGADHLHFIVERVGEQRTQRTVDQTRGQDFLFRRAAFALEEAAGNATGSVGALLIIDRQREEILTRLRILGTDHGGQHNGVFHGHHDSTTSLAGNLGGFESYGMGTVGKALLYRIQHNNSFRQKIKAGTAITAVPACSASPRCSWRRAHRAMG